MIELISISEGVPLECFTDRAKDFDRSTTQPKKGGSTKFHGDFALRVSCAMPFLDIMLIHFSVFVSSRGTIGR